MIPRYFPQFFCLLNRNKMALNPSKVSSVDQIDREEGEIVDDDFEAISDNSIIEPLCTLGKSESKQHLSALSLSSVSELEDELLQEHHRHRKSKKRLRKHGRRRKPTRRKLVCSDSDDDVSAIDNRELQEQLKHAIRINDEANATNHNTLKDRLQAMSKNPNPPEAITPTAEVDDLFDSELFQLRLEALRTAMLNKSEHRKKRKAELNKENTISSKKTRIEEEPNPEEDEDVLRALLLASISKKYAEPNETKTKRLTLQEMLPKVKPLIINVNCGSDTDDTDLSEPEPNKLTSNLQDSVDLFLKEERAKVEATLPKAPPIMQPSAKSAVKLLPKVKQLEYEKLLLRIKNAEKKQASRVRRASLRSNNGAKPVTVVPSNGVDVAGFNKTLSEIRIQKNGRLQMQEKYKSLAPSLKQVSDANADRKQRNQVVKSLIEQLEAAKAMQLRSQQLFCKSVQEFLRKKDELDKKHDAEMAMAKLEEEEPPISIGDPNDVDQIMKKNKRRLGGDYNKYVSPLDLAQRSDDDPLAIICPFEMSGKCRDQECSFKHILRQQAWS